MRIIPAAPPVAAHLSIVAIVQRQFCDSSHFQKRNDFNTIDSMRQFSGAYVYGKSFAVVELLHSFFHVYVRRKLSQTIEHIDLYKENYRNKLSITIDNYRKENSWILEKTVDANGKPGQGWLSIAERWPGFPFERPVMTPPLGSGTVYRSLTSRAENGPISCQSQAAKYWVDAVNGVNGLVNAVNALTAWKHSPFWLFCPSTMVDGVDAVDGVVDGCRIAGGADVVARR